MNNMNKAAKDIKKKLTLNDYTSSQHPQDDKAVEQLVVKPAEEKTPLISNCSQTAKPAESCKSCKHESMVPKLKATFYLDSDANKYLTEVYINRLKNDKKTDRSALICEAIKLLYKNEF